MPLVTGDEFLFDPSWPQPAVDPILTPNKLWYPLVISAISLIGLLGVMFI
jgi:hypothetical protein